MNKLVEAFFYGLYMDEDLLRCLRFTPAGSQKVYLPCYQLDLRGQVKITPHKDSRVWGMLISLPESHLQAMYDFESTRDYVSGSVDVVTEQGGIVAANCYNLPEDSEAEPNLEYLEKLVTLLIKLHFPEDYIASLKKIRNQ